MLHFGEGNGTPLQYSCLENPMDGGAWWAAIHGVAKSRTRLSDFTFTFHFHALEKEMAPHSSVLACRIPGTAEPGGLPSLGSHRVGHDWSDLAQQQCHLKDLIWLLYSISDFNYRLIFLKDTLKFMLKIIFFFLGLKSCSFFSETEGSVLTGTVLIQK